MSTAANAAPLPDAAAKGAPQAPLHVRYFSEILPDCPAVCGRALKPLSIGRYRLMARFKVAFVSGGEETASAGDLLLGVLICSMSVADFKDFMADPGFSEKVNRWGRKQGFFPPAYFSWRLTGKWLGRLFGRLIDAADADYLAGQIKTFQKYIKDGSQAPAYMDETSGGKVSGAHWSQSIEAALRAGLNWSAEEIDEEPLSKAIWDYFKHMENQGLVRLLTDGEIADFEAMEEISDAESAKLAGLINSLRMQQGLEPVAHG